MLVDLKSHGGGHPHLMLSNVHGLIKNLFVCKIQQEIALIMSSSESPLYVDLMTSRKYYNVPNLKLDLTITGY